MKIKEIRFENTGQKDVYLSILRFKIERKKEIECIWVLVTFQLFAISRQPEWQIDVCPPTPGEVESYKRGRVVVPDELTFGIFKDSSPEYDGECWWADYAPP